MVDSVVRMDILVFQFPLNHVGGSQGKALKNEAASHGFQLRNREKMRCASARYTLPIRCGISGSDPLPNRHHL
jgi:hypothetical protein